MTRTTRGVLLVGLLAVVGVVVAAVLVTRGDTGPAAADGTERSAPNSSSVSAVAAPVTTTAQAGPTGAVATDPATSVTGGNVTPVIGYAEWDAAGNRVVAAGFVPGVIESGGF